MYRLFYFIKAIHTTILFIVLEIIAGYLFFTSNPYQRAVALNGTNQVMGAIYDKTSAISGYFRLSKDNELLSEENARLRHRLSLLEYSEAVGSLDTTILTAADYIPVRVIRNSTNKRDNYITINKGWKDGLDRNMALINSEGIVGYILECSKNFSVAISVLNSRDFRTSGKIKDSDYTGTISWDGNNSRVVQFTEIDKYAEISKGDTILTTQFSNIFPENIPIGKVIDFELTNGTHYNANIELFAKISKLSYVYAVKLPYREERAELEQLIELDRE